MGSVPGSGRSPGEGHGNPLQYSCLGNPMDTGAWQATFHGGSQSQTQLSTHITLMSFIIWTDTFHIRIENILKDRKDVNRNF